MFENGIDGSFNAEFWDEFTAQYWGKKPVLFEGTEYCPLTESQLLILLYQYVLQLGTGQATAFSRARAYASGRSIDSEVAKLRDIDFSKVSNFGSMMREVETILGTDSFAFILSDIGHVDADIQRKIQSFIAPLVKREGLPSKLCELGLFGGSYTKTPFGIHRDIGNDNFTFGVVGEKRFLLWPPEYFENIDSTYPLIHEGIFIRCNEDDYQRFKRDAVSFVVRPGDVLYWPDWWHTADLDPGNDQVTLSLGLWKQLDLALYGADLVGQALREVLGEDVVFTGACDPSEKSTDFIKKLLEALAKIESDKAVEKLAQKMWEKRAYNMGFTVDLND